MRGWRRTRRAGVARTGLDDSGQMTVEWALVLAAIALPMYLVFTVCLRLLVAHYQMVSFMDTIPFP